jgi:hypothetical protein
MRTLILISLLGVGLGFYNAYTARRDEQLATGPNSENQRRFFVEAAERPDLEAFFKSLKGEERVAMARNIGRYRDPELASLIGKVLGDFDPKARTELTRSLATIAQAHPDKVAEQLKLTGSFQSLGVTRALKTVGPSAIPLVVKQLEVGDARNNAVAYLVGEGEKAVPPLIESLKHENADVRKAAADALGKIGSHTAVPALTAKYGSSTGDEQIVYLAALSAIGAPESEALFVRNLANDKSPLTWRALAALGLGRIGSPHAASVLWKYAEHPDLDFQAQIISALQLAGDASLRSPERKPSLVTEVAHRVDTPLAESLIRQGLTRTATPPQIRAAEGRPTLVPALAAVLHSIDPVSQGDITDAVIQTLGTTPEGEAELAKLEKNPIYAGFVIRRERLAG